MKHIRRCTVVLFLLPITAALSGPALADTMHMNSHALAGTHSSSLSPSVKSHPSRPDGGTLSVPKPQSHPISHPTYAGPVFHPPIKVTITGGSPQGTICPVHVPEPGEASLLLSAGVFALIFLSVRKRLGLRVVSQR